MRLLVFQHTPGESPAAFAQHAAKAGDDLHVVLLFAGDPIPPHDGFDALLVMGGPMDVWEEDTYPWLVPEKAAIRNWVETGKPYLGVCLGHQLLVEAMGGCCGQMKTPEIAVSEVTRNQTPDTMLSALPDHFPAMHWHGVEAQELPANSHVLASSAGCEVQAIRVGDSAWGVQFHPELEPGTLRQWMGDQGNLDCATDWLGSDEAAWDFVEQAETQAGTFLENSRLMYQVLRAQV